MARANLRQRATDSPGSQQVSLKEKKIDEKKRRLENGANHGCRWFGNVALYDPLIFTLVSQPKKWPVKREPRSWKWFSLVSKQPTISSHACSDSWSDLYPYFCSCGIGLVAVWIFRADIPVVKDFLSLQTLQLPNT